MAVTQVGAFFATASKLLQRVYIPSHNDSEITQQPLAAGETLMNVPLATYQTGGAAAVQALIGAPTFSGRCAIADKNTNLVVGIIIADPSLYTDPNGQIIIADDHAMLGDLWTGTQFTRRYVEINPHAATALASIVAVSTQAIGNPTPVTTGNIMMASATLNVGNAIAPSLFTKLSALP
jgi:hypothetical protein